MRRAILIVAAALACAASAHAETSLVGSVSGYTYFNRPGASLEQYQADLNACHETMRQVRYNRRSTIMNPQAPGWAAGGAALADAVSNTLAARRGYAVNFENCMVVRGWRVMRLSETEGRELEAAQPDALREALGEMVIAEAPPGEVARTWGNDMQDAATTWTGRPGDLDKISLSLRAAVFDNDDEEAPPRAREPRRPRTAFEQGSVGARAAERLPAEQSLIVLTMDGNFSMATTTLRLERIGPDPDQPAWVADGLPAGVDAQLGSIGTNQATFIFRVPPGRWRIASLTQTSGFDYGVYVTDFCLGSPSFEVGAGEAVYAGAFHLRTAAFGPELDLAAMQAALSENAPALAARLRAAEYTNGTTRTCAGTYLYALEVPGAPFVEGYVLASRAGAQQETATP